MNKNREIRVRLPFRILGGLICMGILAAWVLDPSRAYRLWILDLFNLVSLVVVFPLFAYAAVFGKTPDFITRNLNADWFEDFEHTETFFTEFSGKSITLAVVFLSMVFYCIYRTVG